MRKLKRVVGLLILCCAPAAGQAGNSWNNLESLAVGERIRVVKQDKSSHTGTFVAFSSEAVTLRSKGAEVGHRREDVVRVWRVGAARRGRAALIGLAIGAGAGAAVGAASDGYVVTRKEAAAPLGWQEAQLVRELVRQLRGRLAATSIGRRRAPRVRRLPRPNAK